MPRLKRVSDSQPGIRRVARGKGFSYLDRRDTPVRDTETLARIEALAIPPAWTDVWICPEDNGHIQATGTDDAGRRQYLYHPRGANDATSRSSDGWKRSPIGSRSFDGR